MIIKFFDKGHYNDGGSGIKELLLGTPENPREGAKLLRGDPDMTTELINGITNTKIYTSGALFFREDEKITDKQKEEIMDSFEFSLFPTFDYCQYSSYWVECIHEEKWGLYFVFASIELFTGKGLSVYFQKNDIFLVRSWGKLIIGKYDLIDPNAPKNKRDFTGTQLGFKDQSDDRQKERIHNWLIEQVEGNKRIKSREDIIGLLTENGYEVVNVGIKHPTISIKNPNGGRNLKFKGTLYAPDFDRTFLPSYRHIKQQEYENSRPQRIRNLEKDYYFSLEKRKARLNKRFGNIDKSPTPDFADFMLESYYPKGLDSIRFSEIKIKTINELESLSALDKAPLIQRKQEFLKTLAELEPKVKSNLPMTSFEKYLYYQSLQTSISLQFLNIDMELKHD